MSRPPQEYGHPAPEWPHIDSVQHRATPIPYPYARHEPRQLQTPGYERPVPMASFAPRLPALNPLPERVDPRYTLSTDNAYMTRQPMQPLQLRSHPSVVDTRGYYTPHEERSNPILNNVRDYDSQRSRQYDVESQHSSSSTAMPSPVWSDRSAATYSSTLIQPSAQQDSRQPRNVNYRMPHGFDKLLHHEPEAESPPAPPRRLSTQSRYHLHVRQQPIAARACGAGDRDRRPVDPPPIVQILLNDFDSNSQEDNDILQDPRFTVGCLLFPVSPQSPWSEPTESDTGDLDQDREKDREKDRDTDGVARTDDPFSTPLLSGKAFMSPFYVEADPDPNSAPPHPSSINDPRLSSPSNAYNHPSARLHQPATFFIFADLSIRSAGLYRLQFRLMNWGSVEDTGQSMPILAEAWSDPFRVYPAKDFPGMRDSSILAEGLKELGFVELKTRGHGKGKGKKRR